ncbi:MAG: TylF/MycF family methyltransferase, partial [Clostridiales Family XIII bacterium]|nr:TylF/MycF family methyltransferase [Clostridiales Family XIII bacterium]
KLPHPEKAIIRKGYFPDTAVNLPGGFKFVNLDLDLYAPTLKGLRLFYPKMLCGSVILIHDYFPDCYPGVKQAITEFEEELISTGHERLLKIPVGDRISIAIIKR